MKALEILLSRRWILKARDPELYFYLRDELPKIRNFLIEKTGLQPVVNSLLIKLEKIPTVSLDGTGIGTFTDKMEYVLLLSVLIFLEEKGTGEQFVLSELTEYLIGAVEVEKIDWTLYRYRKYLIKVMKFCVGSGILELNDGNEEEFQKDGSGEVLYENTGASRYFVRNFTKDITGYGKVSDFEGEDWIDVNEDRGIVRRQRVYKKLLLSMAMYRNEKTEEDFNYIRNFRGTISDDFSGILDCDLHLHRTSAFLVLNEGGGFGRTYPEENTRSDISLLVNGILLQKIKEGELSVRSDESILMEEHRFKELLFECKAKFGKGFAKTYREMTTKEFAETVSDYMRELGIIGTEEGRIFLALFPF